MTKDMINNGVNSDDKSRIIQEYVPGKQITLAHMVTRPKASVYKKLGLPDEVTCNIILQENEVDIDEFEADYNIRMMN